MVALGPQSQRHHCYLSPSPLGIGWGEAVKVTVAQRGSTTMTAGAVMSAAVRGWS